MSSTPTSQFESPAKKGELHGLELPVFSKVIAVTGTIGSGKSSAVKVLKEQGAVVVSADDIAREVVAPGTPGLTAITARFGPEILTASGELDRKKLGGIVFGDPEQKRALEAITHPLIHEAATDQFKAAIASGRSFLVYEVPILFETGLDKIGFKSIVVISAEDDVCVERIVRRDGLSPEAARKRLRSQMPASEKRARADFVIDNSSTEEALRAQVTALAGRLG